jgi:hypothetical protein
MAIGAYFNLQAATLDQYDEATDGSTPANRSAPPRTGRAAAALRTPRGRRNQAHSAYSTCDDSRPRHSSSSGEAGADPERGRDHPGRTACRPAAQFRRLVATWSTWLLSHKRATRPDEPARPHRRRGTRPRRAPARDVALVLCHHAALPRARPINGMRSPELWRLHLARSDSRLRAGMRVATAGRRPGQRPGASRGRHELRRRGGRGASDCLPGA